jgi:hypothetical protein
MIESILSPTDVLLNRFKDSLPTPERRSGQSAIQSSRKPEQTLGA